MFRAHVHKDWYRDGAEDGEECWRLDIPDSIQVQLFARETGRNWYDEPRLFIERDRRQESNPDVRIDYACKEWPVITSSEAQALLACSIAGACFRLSSRLGEVTNLPNQLSEEEPPMHVREEWEAWQEVVAEFKLLGCDINEQRFTCLVKSICVWGEKLHALRASAPESGLYALKMYADHLAAARAEREARTEEWTYGEPEWIDSESCMGEPQQYWRLTAQRGDKVVMGSGATREGAKAACAVNVLKEETKPDQMDVKLQIALGHIVQAAGELGRLLGKEVKIAYTV